MEIDKILFEKLNEIKVSTVRIINKYDIDELMGGFSREIFFSGMMIEEIDEAGKILSLATNFIMGSEGGNEKNILPYDLEVIIRNIKKYIEIDSAKRTAKENQMEVSLSEKEILIAFPSSDTFKDYIIDNELEFLNVVMNNYERKEVIPIDEIDKIINSFYGKKIDKLFINRNKITFIKAVLEDIACKCSNRQYLKRVFKYSKEALAEDIKESLLKKQIVVKKVVILNIINELLFEVEDIWNDGKSIFTRPLIELKSKEILIIPELFLCNDFERNITQLINELPNTDENKQKFGLLKEESQLQEIAKVLEGYPNLKYKKGVKYKKNGNDYVDADLIIYDEVSKSMLICECKNFLAPASTREHNNFMGIVDKNKSGKKEKRTGIFKAMYQIDKLIEVYETNSEVFSKKIFNENLVIENIDFTIILKDYLGNMSNGKNIMNHRLLEIFLRKTNGDLKGVIKILNDRKSYIPQKDKDFKTVFQKYRIDDYILKIENYFVDEFEVEKFINRVLRS